MACSPNERNLSQRSSPLNPHLTRRSSRRLDSISFIVVFSSLLECFSLDAAEFQRSALVRFGNITQNVGGGRNTIQTVEAIIDEAGRVQLLETVQLKEARRALVTILEEEPTVKVSETALLSEPSLAEDWTRPEEDAAWSYLQSVR